MKRKFIKMNDMKKVSLGNLFNVIKEVAINKNVAMQSEIFSAIFGVNDINITTINNYLVGIRAIGVEYKNLFEEKYNKFLSNYNEFLDVTRYIINILHGKVMKVYSIDFINGDELLSDLVNKMYDICLIDDDVSDGFRCDLKKFIDSDNLYESFIMIIKYAILYNKQPLISNNVNIKINKDELDEFLKIKLHFGESYISSLLHLYNKGNMYASSELGSLEFDGLITGESDYDKCFMYYKTAADFGCPKGCFMVAHLILSGKVKYDFDIMWDYLNKAIVLDSAAAYNTLGKCYLSGMVPDGKVDVLKARECFEISSEYGYTFAYNNLGMLCEKDGNVSEAFGYYKISADMGNSWALNKMGEFYRKKGDMKKAFMYYEKAINMPYKEVCKWAYYNLFNYFSDEIGEELSLKFKNIFENL